MSEGQGNRIGKLFGLADLLNDPDAVELMRAIQAEYFADVPPSPPGPKPEPKVETWRDRPPML